LERIVLEALSKLGVQVGVSRDICYPKLALFASFADQLAHYQDELLKQIEPVAQRGFKLTSLYLFEVSTPELSLITLNQIQGLNRKIHAPFRPIFCLSQLPIAICGK
jgi:hypothetical protein